MIKRFNGKPFRPVETLKIYDARFHTNQEKAEILTRHYQSVSSDKSLDPDFRQHKAKREPEIDKLISEHSDPAPHRIFNAPFTRHELQVALDKKRSTAPGADTVHYDMLKNLTENGMNHLLRLMNKSWKEHKLPEQWKESTIIPLLKPDKDPQMPHSYRPISLTSAIGKVMETMAASRLVTFIEQKKLLGKTQSGFRKNRSTIDQILRLTSAIKTARLRRRSCCAVFLDLEKAFDLIWRKGVLQKLVEYGIEGNMLLWIQNFVTGRKIQVKLGTVLSDLRECLNGSPQGAVLSPILCNLIINTLYEALDALPIDLSQFADDSAIWKCTRKPKAAIKILQEALIIIHNWCKEWGFKISTDKTKVVVFNRRYSTTKYLPKLTLGDKKLEFSPDAQFLGLCFDHQLTWSKHIKTLTQKCQKDLNLMKMVSGTSYGADKKTLIRLYTTLIRSKIDYGCQAYNCASATQLKKLDVIQAAALRIATGAYKGTQNFSLEVECNIMPLQKRRDELQLKYWARSNIHGDNLPINEMVKPHALYETRRSRLSGKIPYNISVQDLIKKHDLGKTKIQPINFKKKHSISSIRPNCELANKIKKKETPDSDSRRIAEKYIKNKYWNHIKIFTDGSKDLENQKSGSAFVIPTLNVTRKFKLHPDLTVYTAELIAIQNALQWILENNLDFKTAILTDSLSAIQSIQSGKSKTRQDILDHVLYLIHCIIKRGLTIDIDWVPSHCNIHENELADAAAKSALNTGKSINLLPSHQEIYPVIKAKIRQEWAKEWKNHHGPRHELDPSLPSTLTQYSDNRRLDRIFTRLRLGDNGLKGNNLKHSEADPICPHCIEVENTEHYLLHCHKHAEARAIMFQALANKYGDKKYLNPANVNTALLLNTKEQEVREILFHYIIETGYETVI